MPDPIRVPRRIFIGAALALPLARTPGSRAASLEDEVASAAARTAAAESLRFVLAYDQGSTEIFGRISFDGAEGTFHAPDRIEATLTASGRLFSADITALVEAGEVEVDLPGPNPSIAVPIEASRILEDVLAILPDLVAALRDLEEGEVEERDGQQLRWVNGLFDPSLLTNPDASSLLGLRQPIEAGVAIDGDGWLAAIRQAGPLVSYDSPDVIRRIDFSEFDAVPGP